MSPTALECPSLHHSGLCLAHWVEQGWETLLWATWQPWLPAAQTPLKKHSGPPKARLKKDLQPNGTESSSTTFSCIRKAGKYRHNPYRRARKWTVRTMGNSFQLRLCQRTFLSHWRVIFKTEQSTLQRCSKYNLRARCPPACNSNCWVCFSSLAK